MTARRSAPTSLFSCARNGMLERRPTLADHLVDQIICGPFRLGQNITPRRAESEWKAISASAGPSYRRRRQSPDPRKRCSGGLPAKADEILGFIRRFF